MDPHSNAKVFAYNSDNSDENHAATTTSRNARDWWHTTLWMNHW